MAPNNPNPQPGEPPRPNPGQTAIGTGYTALSSGQDVRKPGSYFNAQTRLLTYFSPGDTIPGDNDLWYFVSDEPDISLDEAGRALERYGFDLDPNEIQRA